jgi:hypothetical protein
LTNVSSVCFPDTTTQSIVAFRHGNEMYTVRHKAVRPDFNRTLPTSFRQNFYIGIVILVSKESCQSPIPALVHMVRNVGSYNTSDASHVRNLSE